MRRNFEKRLAALEKQLPPKRKQTSYRDPEEWWQAGLRRELSAESQARHDQLQALFTRARAGG
jgi:hypothetical protein